MLVFLLKMESYAADINQNKGGYEMSTVLEKPVLLDETGQAIVGKLNDIKDVIGTSSEFVPIALRVITQPTKTSYIAGESLDLSGLLVKIEATNGTMVDITEECTFSPANGATLSSSDDAVTITYHWYKDNVDFTTSVPLSVKSFTSISVITPPTTVEYTVGDELDLTGIEIRAFFDDNTSVDVTDVCSFNPADGDTLGVSDTEISISCTISGTTRTTTQSIEVTAPIYGAEWDGSSSPIWSRTDDAQNFTNPNPYYVGMSGDASSPFDNIKPWKDIKIVEDNDAGTLVEIPKFYYKWTKEGAKLKLQISPAQQDGFYTSPAHADRGDGQGERDKVYVGRYFCDASTYKSISARTPAVSTTKANFRTNIHNLGSDIWQWDYAMYMTIAMLYLVEFAHWDSQRKIGYGGLASGQNIQDTGATDTMPYHTGTRMASRSYYGDIQYRNIEGLWSNCSSILDGVYFYESGYPDYDKKGMYIIKDPSKFHNGPTGDGTKVGVRSINGGGILSELTPSVVDGYEYALIPTETVAYNANVDTYCCDTYSGQNAGTMLFIGGNGENNQIGLFNLRGDSAATASYNKVSSRLMKLPSNS